MSSFEIKCDSPSLIQRCTRHTVYNISSTPMYNATSLQSIPVDSDTSSLSNGDVIIYDNSTNQWTYGSTSPSSIASYGQMFALSGQNVSIPGNGTFVPITGMSSITSLNNNVTFSEDPPSTLTVVNTGIYTLSVGVDGSSSANGVDITSDIFINGITEPRFSLSRHFQQNGDDGSVYCSGLISLTQGDSITLRFASTGATTFNTHNINVTLLQVS